MSDTAQTLTDTDLAEMARVLARNGYLVAKIPPCKLHGRGHGRHGLITRTAICEGEEPIPHGFKHLHQGSFGCIVTCSCGQNFSDDYREDPSPWEKHKAEHGFSA